MLFFFSTFSLGVGKDIDRIDKTATETLITSLFSLLSTKQLEFIGFYLHTKFVCRPPLKSLVVFFFFIRMSSVFSHELAMGPLSQMKYDFQLEIHNCVAHTQAIAPIQLHQLFFVACESNLNNKFRNAIRYRDNKNTNANYVQYQCDKIYVEREKKRKISMIDSNEYRINCTRTKS